MNKLILLLAGLLCLGSPARAEERVDLPELGISVTAPDGWQRISGDRALAHLRDIRLEREEFQKRLAQGSEPIVSLRKRWDRGGLVPIVNFGFNPIAGLGGRTPVQFLERTAEVASQALGDFEILEAPREVRVSGLPAAHMRIAYTQTQQEVRRPSISEYWIIPRGAYYFFIGTGYADREDAVTRREIKSIIDSIAIESSSR